MDNDYIYILSNASLKHNILKIGFTSKPPAERALALSRSTSIPTDYKVEYSAKTKDKRKVETRVHLILSKCRVNSGKEFFNVSLNDAVNAIQSAMNYTEIHDGISAELGLHKEISLGNTSPILNCNGIKTLLIMMASTASNTRVNILLKHFEIEYGFLSSDNFAEITKNSITTSNNILRDFCKKNKNLVVYKGDEMKEIQVFIDISYSKGQCMWIFNPELRCYFFNSKMTHLK